MNGLNDIERVKQLYAIIVHGQLPDDPDSIQKKIDIVRELEKIVRQDFLSTADFHEKINSFLRKRTSIRNDSIRFQEKRKGLGLTQEDLAQALGVSVRRIKHWEAGTRHILLSLRETRGR